MIKGLYVEKIEKLNILNYKQGTKIIKLKL